MKERTKDERGRCRRDDCAFAQMDEKYILRGVKFMVAASWLSYTRIFRERERARARERDSERASERESERERERERSAPI